jgi:hypothetical protein
MASAHQTAPAVSGFPFGEDTKFLNPFISFCHIPDVVLYYENRSFFWTLSMSISAKLRDLGIEGLRD